MSDTDIFFVCLCYQQKLKDTIYHLLQTIRLIVSNPETMWIVGNTRSGWKSYASHAPTDCKTHKPNKNSAKSCQNFPAKSYEKCDKHGTKFRSGN